MAFRPLLRITPDLPLSAFLAVLLAGCSSESERAPASNRSASTSTIPGPGAEWRRTGNPRVHPLPVAPGRGRSQFTQGFNRALAEFRREWLSVAVSVTIVDASTGRPERLDPAPRGASARYRLDPTALRTLVARRSESLSARGTTNPAAGRLAIAEEIARLRRAAALIRDAGRPSSGPDSLSTAERAELRRASALDVVLERAAVFVATLRDPRGTRGAIGSRRSADDRSGRDRDRGAGERPAPDREAALPLVPILATRMAELRWDDLFAREGEAGRRPETFAPLSRDEANELRDRRARIALDVDAVNLRLRIAYARMGSASLARAEVLRDFASIDRAVAEQRKALDRLAQTLRDDRIEGERVRLEQTREWIATRKFQDAVNAWRPAR